MLCSCITATSQSATSYTAVYTEVGSFVVTALICVIIVLAILRYDIIVFIIFSIFFWTANINKNYKRGHFNNEDDVDYLFSIGAGSAAPLCVALETQIQSILY